jgi:hypothetical protein
MSPELFKAAMDVLEEDELNEGVLLDFYSNLSKVEKNDVFSLGLVLL